MALFGRSYQPWARLDVYEHHEHMSRESSLHLHSVADGKSLDGITKYLYRPRCIRPQDTRVRLNESTQHMYFPVGGVESCSFHAKKDFMWARFWHVDVLDRQRPELRLEDEGFLLRRHADGVYSVMRCV